MSALAFDTLTATKELRSAGVDEPTAEAIVRVVSRSSETPIIDHLATREQLEAVDKRLLARLDLLQSVVFVGIGLNLAGFLGVAAFLYAVLKHA